MFRLGFFLSTKCHLKCFSSNKQFLYYHIRYINILSLSLSVFTACFKTHFFSQVTEASICFSKITLRIFKITLSLFRSNLASPVNHFLIASLKQEMSSFEWLPELIYSSTENTTWKKKKSDHKPPPPQKPFTYQKCYSGKGFTHLPTVWEVVINKERGGFNSKSSL